MYRAQYLKAVNVRYVLYRVDNAINKLLICI